MKKIYAMLLLLGLLTASDAMADDWDLYLLGADASYTCLDYANLQSLSFTQTREENSEGTKVYVNRVHVNRPDGTSTAYDLAGYEAIVFERTAVGIDRVVADEPAPTAKREGIYDLSGRRLKELPAQSGLYIVNGKKVFVK